MKMIITTLLYRIARRILYRFFTWLPDKLYIKILYRVCCGKRLNLKVPLLFSEKLQWLKLFDRRQEYTIMVDKFAVKEYVASIIGNEYVIQTLGIWDRAEDIEWDQLPDSFVLKTTHGGGSVGVVICKNKATFDYQSAVKKLNQGLKQNIYKYYREWPYKNVPHKIMAEKYIAPAFQNDDLPDYKWYCFSGEPKYCQVIKNRSSEETIDFFDTEWNHQDFVGLNSKEGPFIKNAVGIPIRPKYLDTQIRLARELSKDIPFARIDLYEIGDHIYFGEITLFPFSGLGYFTPHKYNELIGKMVKLPIKYC